MDRQAPVVSVIIPVFNIAQYLPQCLDSLLAQSFRDYEVLCVDDASEDGSDGLIERYAQQDSRIRLVRQPHAGVSAARNLGISQARGEYILFFDGDDWAEPEMLSQLVTAAEADRADVTVCSAAVMCESEDAPAQRRVGSLRRELTVQDRLWEAGDAPEAPWQALELPGSWPFIWNKLIRRSLIRDNGILFSRQLQLGEDGLFVQILYQYARKIRFVSPALYHYRFQRKNSATVRLFDAQRTRFSQHTTIVRCLCGELEARGRLKANRDALLRWTADFLYRDFVDLPAQVQVEASAEVAAALEKAEPEGTLPGGRLLKKRIGILCHSKSAPTELGRLCRIVQTKIENRLMRIFSQKK